MSQNMESSEDVCPLDHLSQGPPLEDFGAENISRLFGQEAHMDQNLGKKGTNCGVCKELQWKEYRLHKQINKNNNNDVQLR